MRVIAGQWRGRVLKSPSGDDVRPTTDRVKEAMFSILGPRVSGSLVLDLCSGSGGLGVEALSRGAEKVIFVDQSASSLKVTRANLDLCGATSSSYELVRRDVVQWLDHWVPDRRPFYVLADPPYRSGLPWSIFQKMVDLQGYEGFAGAVLEKGSGRNLDWPEDEDPALLPGCDVRRYGQSSLVILKPQGEPEV